MAAVEAVAEQVLLHLAWLWVHLSADPGAFIILLQASPWLG